MAKLQIGEKEKRFADMIWDAAPVRASELAAAAKKELGWARSTAYTVLRRLVDKEIFTNTDGVVTARISRDAFEAGQSRAFVEECFSGSLPSFLAAFSDGKKLTSEEISALEELIERSRSNK